MMFAFDSSLDALVILPAASGQREPILIPRSQLQRLGYEVSELPKVLPRHGKPSVYLPGQR
jgi:hypothetical protein